LSYHLFTSESVSEGHPDKVCDQISDAVLDAYLAKDPKARVACEAFAHTGCIHLAGQITSTATVDLNKIIRQTLLDIGYDNPAYGIDGRSCAVLLSIDPQSPDIAQGVDDALEHRGQGSQDLEEQMGAGDQGLMFGYACRETEELMPLGITLSHKLVQQLAKVRKNKEVSFLRPDSKSQVTVKYGEDGEPCGIETILISTQHDEGIELSEIRKAVIDKVIKPVVPAKYLKFEGDELVHPRILVNPTGKFVIGGPEGDTGLTGRKIIVDTYGGMARHGGGAFSGKDPTKVDRSANYAARWVAKNVVAAGLADRCEVALSYAIGVAEPVSIAVNTEGTGRLADAKLEEIVAEVFDLRPGAIVKNLDLRRPIYRPVAAYGHFGRPELNLPWEQTNKVEQLKAKAAATASA
jgi:S-adenosylmethionine synthetase